MLNQLVLQFARCANFNSVNRGELTISVLDAEIAMGPLNEVEKRNCPAKLFLAGDPSLLKNGKRVSLVGSREATERGLEAASKLAALLARSDIIVNSS